MADYKYKGLMYYANSAYEGIKYTNVLKYTSSEEEIALYGL